MSKKRLHSLLCNPLIPTLDWVEMATTFRYCSNRRHDWVRGHGPLFAPVSFRKERRRRGHLWYVYRRVHGVLHKRYVGRSDGLTAQRLEETAVLLNEIR